MAPLPWRKWKLSGMGISRGAPPAPTQCPESAHAALKGELPGPHVSKREDREQAQSLRTNSANFATLAAAV
jgi:hypothetical protein